MRRGRPIPGIAGTPRGRPATAGAAAPGPPHVLVRTPADLDLVATALDEGHAVGLRVLADGPDPRAGRVRLLALDCDTCDGTRFAYVVDCEAVDPAPLWHALSARPVLVHGGRDDLVRLARLGFAPGPARDLRLDAQLLAAGTAAAADLGACLGRFLGAGAPAGTAGPARLAAEAAALRPLADAVDAALRDAGLAGAAAVERRCLPAVAWLAGAGVPLDGGRAYPEWHQLGAASGRMRCSGPNVQQTPRGDARRRVAAPPGRASSGPTTPRSSCGSRPRWPGTRPCSTPSAGARTCTPARPGSSSGPPRRPTPGGWPRR